MAMDHGRDPCPWVILNDFGGAFAMGVRLHPAPPPLWTPILVDYLANAPLPIRQSAARSGTASKAFATAPTASGG